VRQIRASGIAGMAPGIRRDEAQGRCRSDVAVRRFAPKLVRAMVVAPLRQPRFRLAD